MALALGLPHDHLTVGVPAHGILYKLANTSQTTPGSPAIPWNYNDAIISHTKVCLSFKTLILTLLSDRLTGLLFNSQNHSKGRGGEEEKREEHTFD